MKSKSGGPGKSHRLRGYSLDLVMFTSWHLKAVHYILITNVVDVL